MIDVKNLSRNYGNYKAVDDVSFSISHGEIVGLLGHNGAGKTTIMKMLTGYLEPTEGTITIEGLDMRYNRQKNQRKIGYLPENCPVYPEMSVLGYLEYAATLHGLAKEERKDRILQAIRRTDLYHKAGQQIATLSRGYRQRTGVAQAIIHHPSILILDEPTNGLDPTQIKQMRSLITELAQNSTVMISTHILQEVQAICDRVLIIKDGQLALDSRLDELQKDTRLLLSIDQESSEAVPVFTKMSSVTSASRRPAMKPDDKKHHYELMLSTETDNHQQAAAIAKTIHNQGWQLFSMQFEARNLETVFADISA